MDILFEITGKHHPPHIERVRVEPGSAIHIGRGYNNDVILHDLQVSPQHGCVHVAEDGHWSYEDLDSLNGSFLGKKQRIHRSRLASGDVLRLGGTLVRILLPDHPVTAAAPANLSPLLERLESPVTDILVILLCFGVFACVGWLGLTDARKPSEWIIAELPFVGILCFWTGNWIFIGKLHTREGRFLQQMTIAALMIASYQILDGIMVVINFNVGNAATEKIAAALVIIMVVGSACYFGNLCAKQEKSPYLAANSLGASILLALLLIFLPALKDSEFSAKPDYIGTIAPPMFVFRHGETIDTFVYDGRSIFAHE